MAFDDRDKPIRHRTGQDRVEPFRRIVGQEEDADGIGAGPGDLRRGTRAGGIGRNLEHFVDAAQNHPFARRRIENAAADRHRLVVRPYRAGGDQHGGRQGITEPPHRFKESGH